MSVWSLEVEIDLENELPSSSNDYECFENYVSDVDPCDSAMEILSSLEDVVTNTEIYPEGEGFPDQSCWVLEAHEQQAEDRQDEQEAENRQELQEIEDRPEQQKL